MKIKRLFIKVEGIVQGVGFRPFVYNTAVLNNLKGWVNNTSEGVFIDIEGYDDNLDNFLNELRLNPPPLSRVEKINIVEKNPFNFHNFEIKESLEHLDKITLISPDISICKDCREDILDPNNRRYFYPFTNCTNCGPRYSIIRQIPYDRNKTTMENFEMCPECTEEYNNPLNRRFHAQPNACHNCGPHIYLTDSKGVDIPLTDVIYNQELPDSFDLASNKFNINERIINWTQKKLKEGFIFAIKGLTGFHLVCDGENPNALDLLRKRKHRPDKPFAVMMKDINMVKKYCSVSNREEELLSGVRKPIVLLNKLDNYSLPEALAPNQNTLGVMLPFTPLHELLFLKDLNILVMTSANVHGLPLEHINDTAVENLAGIVDYFLMHDRDIFIPVDDSVSKVVLGSERIIRRARGYAPEPITFKTATPILACGSNMKNTTCISKDSFLFLSPHNGDLENIETYEHYKSNIEHFKSIFAFNPRYIVSDMHPGYYSTQYAQSCDTELIQVQHHHAHIVSCMVENGLSSKVIGISFDGTGYGTDGKIWGSEFLICDYENFNRAAHLDYVIMPGGDTAISEPWKMGVSYLHHSLSKDNTYIKEFYGNNAEKLLKIIDKNINCTEASSMGRFFDAVSSILDICQKVTFEGQASMELEALISTNSNTNDYTCYDYKIFSQNNELIINTAPIINGIINDLKTGTSKSKISERFHNTVISFSVDICKRLRTYYNINDVALSGGVFQNNYLFIGIVTALKNEGFNVFSHSKIPTNDGGIALGQIVIANETIKSKIR
ncbi:carbamoyltransferase HypF [Clostridium chromiireducens]|uniref:Carbamoyltransferase n=1 Tax=Clostridium chromiireducens TaxID=225345 RepID=A0A399ITV7_9CLOT|nr:carbamoyltransferase HypF [Clostridium chromiireducens]RII36528.1 carbamoyltransferase HypF [Clostridium chromiireducens]